MGCGIKLIRFLLFIFNFVFMILAIAVLAIGIVYKLEISEATKYLEIINGSFPVVPDLFIAVGTVAFLISFLGCCGAWKKSRWMLIIFVILLIVLLIVEVAAAVIGFIGLKQIDETMEMKMKNALRDELQNGELDKLQESLKCCGVIGASDYKGDIPDSCCAGKPCVENNSYKGCYNVILDELQYVGVSVGALGITVAVAQILGAIFALTLSGEIKKGGY